MCDCLWIGSSVVHCPESNCKLASGYCPVPKLIDKSDQYLLFDWIELIPNSKIYILIKRDTILTIIFLLDVNVALGTDGTASNNDLDMFVEMRTAVLLGKINSHSHYCVYRHHRCSSFSLFLSLSFHCFSLFWITKREKIVEYILLFIFTHSFEQLNCLQWIRELQMLSPFWKCRHWMEPK